jgi:transposase
MLERGKLDRGVVEIVDTESLVPQEHLLRKIDAAVDFNRIYEMVELLYCEDNGRPSIDPAVLFKMVLIQHLYGLPSLRRTAEEVGLNVAYRWFLGYTLQEETPHFSTVSYNFRHRFTVETVDQIFEWILDEVAEAGYLAPCAVFIDGTHIKANANTKKQVKAEIPVASKRYAKELMDEVNADREAHEKKPFDDDGAPPSAPKKKWDNTSKKKLARRKKEKTKTVLQSTTDPDCGLFVKGEHKRQFAYEAHTACDANGFVLEVEVTPGNVHDSVAFDDVYDKVVERFPEVETVVVDTAYKTPHICKKVFDDKRVLSTAYKRPQTMKGGHEWWKYVYDEHFDCVICPEFQVLKYSTTNRDGYREYKSDPRICANCLTRELCTHSKDCVKTVQRHIWKDYEELADDARYIPEYRDLYAKRKETIERVFADAKEKHAMRYTQYRGLTQVTKWVRLKFAAMNLKKMAKWKWRFSTFPLYFAVFALKSRILNARIRLFRQADHGSIGTVVFLRGSRTRLSYRKSSRGATTQSAAAPHIWLFQQIGSYQSLCFLYKSAGIFASIKTIANPTNIL